MNRKSLIILGISTWVIIVLAFVLNQQASVDEEFGTDQLLFTALKSKLAEVGKIELRTSGDNLAVELLRKDGKWVVANRFDYPADFKQVDTMINDLAEAKLIEAKTKNPDNYERLGVGDISDATSAAIKVDVYFENQDQPLSVLVGNSPASQTGRYIRKPQEPQTWLIDKTVDVESNPKSWLAKSIVDLPINRIKRIQIKQNDQPQLEIFKAKAEDVNFTVANIPEGRELTYDAVANVVGNSLSNVTHEDVLPRSQFEFSPDQFQAEYETFDGLVLSVKTQAKDDQYFMTVAARFEPSAVSAANSAEVDNAPAASTTNSEQSTSEQSTSEQSADASTSAASDTDNATANPQAEVETINARTAQWVYEISQYTYNSITKKTEDLLKKPPETTSE